MAAGETLAVQAAVAAVVAGAWITAATVAAERLGSKRGGLVANLPSNILVSLAFVALAQGPAFAVAAAAAVPVGMAVDTVWLVVVVLLLPRGLAPALGAGFAAWAALAWLAQAVAYADVLGNLALYALVALGGFAVLERGGRIPSVRGEGRRYAPRQLLARALFAGGVVGATVLASGFVASYGVGLLAVFPAVLASTMVILHRTRGPAFARASGKVLVLSSSNIVVYGLAVQAAYPALGIAAGTVVALALAVLWVALLHPLLRRVS